MFLHFWVPAKASKGWRIIPFFLPANILSHKKLKKYCLYSLPYHQNTYKYDPASHHFTVSRKEVCWLNSNMLQQVGLRQLHKLNLFHNHREAKNSEIVELDFVVYLLVKKKKNPNWRHRTALAAILFLVAIQGMWHFVDNEFENEAVDSERVF